MNIIEDSLNPFVPKRLTTFTCSYDEFMLFDAKSSKYNVTFNEEDQFLVTVENIETCVVPEFISIPKISYWHLPFKPLINIPQFNMLDWVYYSVACCEVIDTLELFQGMYKGNHLKDDTFFSSLFYHCNVAVEDGSGDYFKHWLSSYKFLE